MATVKDILAYKGAQLLSIAPEASAHTAAVRMHEHKVGSLVVMSGGAVVGIVTERDLLHKVLVPQGDPAQTTVGAVMTPEVSCCHPHTTLDEVRTVMKNRRFRHLPVVDEAGQLCGMISIGDINAHEARSQEVTIHVLQEYISGRA